MKNQKSLSVAAFINAQITVSDVSQKDIAAALGYKNPNVITMIKQGRTKLPINKVGQMAKALGVDPVHLLRLVMSEYTPNTWHALQQMIGKSLITANEMVLVEIIRKSCGTVDLELKNKAEREAFIAVIEDIAFNQYKPGFGR